MRPSEKDIALFKALSKSRHGRDLVDYLERLKSSLFEPESLTKENLEAKKEAEKLIREEIIKRITMVNDEKESDNTEYI